MSDWQDAEEKLDIAIASLQECRFRFIMALLNIWHIKDYFIEQEEIEAIPDGNK